MSKFFSLSIIFLLITACNSPQPTSTALPKPTNTLVFTGTPKNTPTHVPTAIPEKFKIKTDPNQPSISLVTLEDVSSGDLALFEHKIVDKQGRIARYKPDYNVGYMNSVGMTQLEINKYDEAHVGWYLVYCVEFLSIYNIKLEYWGFNGKVGKVAAYTFEDGDGNKAVFHFLLSKFFAQQLAEEDFFATEWAKLTPTDSMKAGFLDNQFITGKPNGEDDLRAISRNFYEAQGYKSSDIRDLFTRISETDRFSPEDIKMLESILFFGLPSPSNRDTN